MALVEFAAVLPVLVVMFYGGFELARYSLTALKIDRVAASTGDLVSRLSVVTNTELADLFDSGRDIMAPFDLQTNGRVIVSSVHRPTSAAATVAWQCNDGGSGSGLASMASHIGAVNGLATLPAGFTLAQGQDIIIAESLYHYTPSFAGSSGKTVFLGTLFGSTDFYKVHYYRPRDIYALDTLSGGCP
jgi:Flp pilus assembly protein TadG